MNNVRAWLLILVLCWFSPRAGLAQTDPSSADRDVLLVEDDGSPLGDRTPVILIHGLGANNSITAPDINYFRNLINLLSGSPLAARMKIYRFHYANDRYAVREIARALRNAIDARTLNTPGFDRPLVLVAHSLGGLIARSYMNDYAHQTGQYLGQRGGERVTKLITLATPHHGNPAAGEQSWQAISTNAAWSSFIAEVLRVFFGSQMWNQPNRGDLLWDNVDGRLPAASPELNQWLSSLNQNERYDSKLAAYDGYLTANDPNGVST